MVEVCEYAGGNWLLDSLLIVVSLIISWLGRLSAENMPSGCANISTPYPAKLFPQGLWLCRGISPEQIVAQGR